MGPLHTGVALVKIAVLQRHHWKVVVRGTSASSSLKAAAILVPNVDIFIVYQEKMMLSSKMIRFNFSVCLHILYFCAY